MDKIFTDFGVQPIYLAAQAFNFVILLLILKKFLYKPLLNVLEHRKQTVKETLAKSRQIQTALESTQQEVTATLEEASKEAKAIVDNASEKASKIIIEAQKNAETEAMKIIDKGKKSISVEREMMKKEMRKELAGLVIMGLETVAGKTLQQKDHEKIVEQAVNNLREKVTS